MIFRIILFFVLFFSIIIVHEFIHKIIENLNGSDCEIRFFCENSIACCVANDVRNLKYHVLNDILTWIFAGIFLGFYLIKFIYLRLTKF
ncbi:hypothetical protein DRN69_00215 [Candidatus Pacearchaeota archaeon]|nr:MAG: hypothetical protein DRN69_00215 [Candidatus Pacearchaeota archaeon]